MRKLRKKIKCCEYGPRFPLAHPNKSNAIVTQTKAQVGLLTMNI